MSATWNDGTPVVLDDVQDGEQLVVQHKDGSSKAIATKLTIGWRWDWQDGDTEDFPDFSDYWVVLAGWGRTYLNGRAHRLAAYRVAEATA